MLYILELWSMSTRLRSPVRVITRGSVLAAVALASAAAAPSLAAAQTMPSSCQGNPSQGRVTLPADDAAHMAPLEWWYYTGHLVTASGRRLGFDLEFWANEERITRVDAAVTDDARNRFRFVTSPGTGQSTGGPNGFDLSGSGQVARGGDGHDQIEIDVAGYELKLDLESIKRPVLHFGDGYIDLTKQTDGIPEDTYYYSRPRMATTGMVTIDGKQESVSGNSWFDHQWGQMEGLIWGPMFGWGWDWVAIQLDDGRDVMLYKLRRSAHDLIAVGGDVTDANCHTVELQPSDFSYTPTGSWTRPDGSCTYPMGWNLRLGDQTMRITPTMPNQEMRSAYNPYWEGDTNVNGDATGKAYTEMLGYCR